MKKTKALVLLNMGAARNKDELEIFLTNMFNDKNILGFQNDTIRSIIASLIVKIRLKKFQKNYEEKGEESPLYQLTEQLVTKLARILPDYFITTAMRYTSPFAETTITRIKKEGIKNVTLLPLYPQYSTTTTKSSLDDFVEKSDGAFRLKIIEPFYKNKIYNKAVCDEIIRVQAKYNDFHLIFSAYGVSQKIIDKGDPYQLQIEEHFELLKDKLAYYATNIKSINLAYQSKSRLRKSLTPSLVDMLKNFKNEKVIIYPISFCIDNSETIFKLDKEYREIAKKIGIKDYRVCSCVNDNTTFTKALKEIITL